MGVSHRRLFSGWEPAEVTTYEYEGDKLIRAVTVREPEFTPEGSALLLASKRRAGEFNSLGIPYDEATDPANQFAYKAQTVPTVDWSVKALRDKQDAHYKAYPNTNRNGHIWGKVTRRAATE